MTAPAKKERRGGRRKPSEQKQNGCQLCGYKELAVGTIANNRVGPKCLGIIERIAERNGFSLPLPEFTPFKKKS